MGEGQQPALHDLVTVLCAPSVAISTPDGQLEPGGAQGVYRNDRRMLSSLRFGVAGADLIPTGSSTLGAGAMTFHGVVRDHADLDPDPTVRYVRERTVDSAGLDESWSIRNDATADMRVTVTLAAASDLAGMDAIKSGVATSAYSPTAVSGSLRWEDDCRVVELVPSEPADLGADGLLRWDALVPARGRWDVRLRVDLRGETSTIGFLPQRPTIPVEIAAPTTVGGHATVGGDATVDGHATADGEARRLLQRSLSDLGVLQLADPSRPRTTFLAAGSPWYFTLFGRDSLWAARLLLPSSTELAAGTLRVLASLQGSKHDPDTDEEPGKIPHELRPASAEHGGPGEQAQLPALYYGTVDATPLWVRLLYAAWRANMPDHEVAELIPALRRALCWIAEPGDADGDGFLEYVTRPGVGLSHQGWKDSGDGIRWADGTQATGPIALSEAQAYAYAAAIDGAELLQAFPDQCPDGSPGDVADEVAHWRAWAAGLRQRFRDAFWISDEYGTYPAIALDGRKRPVTGPASNMGHLLGTGLLDAEEVELVAAQLAHPSMDSGYGLRTLSSETAGFNPLSYHCGSIWPHDNAIAVMGLAAEGQHETAAALARGVVRAARRFDYRMPELYGGTSATEEPVIAYPASCAPQAWSAAGAAAIAAYLSE